MSKNKYYVEKKIIRYDFESMLSRNKNLSTRYWFNVMSKKTCFDSMQSKQKLEKILIIY